MPRLLLVGLVLCSVSTRLIAGDAPKPTEEELRFFETKVRPVLVEQCGKCHGPDKQKAGLRLDSRASALAGGETGPAIVPGKPDESLLIVAIGHPEDGPKMPPSKKLPAQTIADLTRWVAIGAPWTPDGSTDAAAPSKAKGPYRITEKDRNHWAFRPIRTPDVPRVDDPAWSRNPIDAFVLDGLKRKGLTPNPPASKRDLIRRATYDLTGLPPTPAEVDAFVDDPSPGAYEALVDRLLASPRYGEKWGRHWLDLVRFAETNSYERDGVKPNAWRYRDYVIRSLNDDKPYDRFVVEQLAGDELPDAGPDAIVATGFHRLGIWDDEPSDRELAHYDGYDDIVATTGQVFLGLTIDCARCHDHKLDPIPQADYYRLVSFFRNVNHYRNGGPTDEAPIFATPEAKAAHARAVAEGTKRLGPIQAEIAAIEDEYWAKVGEASARRPDLSNLRYRFYRDTWDRLPDFDAIKAETSGDLPAGFFDLKPRTRDAEFGFVFEGDLLVPRDGTYTFEVDSDDGSRLVVAGKTVVDHDGVHLVGNPRKATIALKKGQVPIRLDYFQHDRRLGLSVHWSGPDLPRKRLSAPDRPTPDIKTIRRAELARKVMNDGRRALSGGSSPAIHPAPSRPPRDRGGPRPAREGALRHRGRPDGARDVRPPPGQPAGQGREGRARLPPGPRRRPRDDPAPGPRSPVDRPTAGPRPMDRLAGEPAHRPGHRQPRLAAPFRPGPRPVGEQLRPPGRPADPPRAARLGRDEPGRRRLAAQVAPPSDHDVERLQDVVRLESEGPRRRPDQRRALAVRHASALRRGDPRLDPRRHRDAQPHDVRARRLPRDPRRGHGGPVGPGRGWGKSPPEEQARRSVYVHVKRSLLLPILESFDVAETDRSSPSRFATTQPTQALAMINGAFLNNQASALADRLKREAGADRRRQVELAIKLATSRTPTDLEVHRGLDLIAGLVSSGASPDAALRSYCLVVLNLNEFLYLD